MADVDLEGLPHYAVTASLSVQSHVKESGSFNGQYAPSADNLKSAIEKALRSGQVFRDLQERDAEYSMDITLRTAKDSSSGTSFTVLIVMDWRLTDSSTSGAVWKSRVSTSHTATFSDAFSAAGRRAKAAERSIQKNIEKALGQLAASEFANQHALGANPTEEK